MNILFVAKIPTLEFGSTWRARMESRFRKARARCWETCFLLLANMTSRHCSTIPMSSLVPPQKQNFIQRVKNHFMDIQLHALLWAGHWTENSMKAGSLRHLSSDTDTKHPPFFGQNLAFPNEITWLEPVTMHWNNNNSSICIAAMQCTWGKKKSRLNHTIILSEIRYLFESVVY